MRDRFKKDRYIFSFITWSFDSRSMLSLSFWALWRLIFWLDGSHEWWWLDGFWVLWLIFKALLKQVFFYHFWVLILCYHLVNLFDGLTDHILLVRIFSGIQFNIKHPNSEKFLVFDDFWEWLCITDKRKNHICFFLWWSAFLSDPGPIIVYPCQ